MGGVVIVDDCPELRYLIALLLERDLQIDCLALESLDEVVSHADSVLASEVILVDVNLGMGQPDGIAVYEWLRAHDFKGRIFFLTGHALESPQVKQAAKTGVQIFEKPMSPKDFVDVLEQSLSAGAA